MIDRLINLKLIKQSTRKSFATKAIGLNIRMEIGNLVIFLTH